MSQKKNEGILFPTEIRVVGSYTDRLLIAVFAPSFEYKSITELGRFLVSFTSTKYMFVLLLVLLLTKRTDFQSFSYT